MSVRNQISNYILGSIKGLETGDTEERVVAPKCNLFGMILFMLQLKSAIHYFIASTTFAYLLFFYSNLDQQDQGIWTFPWH